MSVKLMATVWDIEALSASEKLVLLSLADHANDDGFCYPSVPRLARRSGMTDRGIRKVIQRLVEAGFLTVDLNAGQGGANVYRLHLTPEPCSPLPPEHGSALNEVHPGTTFPPPPGTTFPTPLNHVPQTPEPRSAKPSGTIIEPLGAAQVRGVLCEFAGETAVDSFMAYRKRQKGKALTLTGAKRLAGHLQKIRDGGGDTDDALGLAEERGWQSVEPGWYFREAARTAHEGISDAQRTVPSADWRPGAIMAPPSAIPPAKRDRRNPNDG